jgi:DNA repair exonuclease SbcCD ATPase subunit
MEQSERNNNSVLKAGLILAVALAALFGFLYFNARQENSKLNVNIEDQTKILLTTQSKLDSMTRSLDEKIAEVTALGGQVEELEALKAQLERDKKQLLTSKNVSIKEYQDKIKNYDAILIQKDGEIAILRQQNAQLTTQNQTLTSENSNLKTENTGLQTTKTALTDSVYSYNVRNKELAEKVTLASALKAINTNVTAINSRGREREGAEYKARRVDKVKVTTKLLENPLTKRENKTIYLRLLDPAGNVISDMATGSGAFSFGGKETVYTAKQTILYDNSGQAVDFIYSRGAPYEKGTYGIELYSEGFRIGQSTFTIK